MNCPKCGKNEAHFVPPSFGEAGFYICESPTYPGSGMPCQSIKDTMTLTREQVGQALNNAVDHGEVDDADYQAIMDTDAALRKERDQWKETFERSCDDVKALRQRVADLQAQWHYAATCDAEMDHVAETFRLKQQLAQVRTERNESYMTIATLRGHLDVLCQAIEAREHDEDYLRRRAAEGRMALAQGRGA